MSDTSTATPEAPAAPAAQPAPEPAPQQGEAQPSGEQGQQQPKPISARDFDKAIYRRNEAPAQSPATQEAPAKETPASQTPVGKVDANGRPHGAPGSDKPGQFLPGQQAEGAEAPQEATDEGGDEPAAAEGEAQEGAQDGTGDEPQAASEGEPSAEEAEATAADEVPEGYVRIEIPEALQRNFGREQVVPKEQEEFFRFNLNNHIRSAEHEKLKRDAQRAKELETQLQEERQKALRLEVGSGAQARFLETPEGKEIAQEFQRLKTAEEDGALEEGTASRYWKRAAQPAYERFVSSQYEERSQEYQAQQNEQIGNQWAAEVRQQANELPASVTALPQFSEVVETALEDFDELVVRPGRFPSIENAGTQEEAWDASKQEFRRFLGFRLLQDPRTSPAMKQLIQSHQAKQAAPPKAPAAPAKATPTEPQNDRQAEQRRRKEAEEQARKAAENPMGNVASNQQRGGPEERPTMNARQFDRLMSRR